MAILPFQSRLQSLVSDVIERITQLPVFTGLRQLLDRAAMRLEYEHHDDRYDVHAQIPGIDPANDVDVSVEDGLLTISADRARSGDTPADSEFRYGSFTRSVQLPDGARPDDLSTRYHMGILTVSVPVSPSESSDEPEDEPEDDASDEHSDEPGAEPQLAVVGTESHVTESHSSESPSTESHGAESHGTD